jgi:hypothetical protein
MSFAPDFELFSSLRFDPKLINSSPNTALAPESCPFYMMQYHRDRMLHAAKHFKWERAVARLEGPQGLEYLLVTLKAAVHMDGNVPKRVRTVLNWEGKIEVEVYQALDKPLRNLFPSKIPPPSSVQSQTRVSSLTGGALTVQDDEPTMLIGAGYGDPQQKSPPMNVYVDPKATPATPFTSFKTTNRDMYTSARERVGIKTFDEPSEVLIINTEDEIMEGSVTSVYFWRGGRWVTPPLFSGGQDGTTRRWLLSKKMVEEEVVKRESLKDGEECWLSNGVRGLMWGVVQMQ